MLARAHHFVLAHAVVEQPVELVGDDVDDFLDPLGRAARADPEQARVAVALLEGRDLVGQPAFLADALEQARRHSAAEQRVEHREGVTALVAHRQARRAEQHVGLLGVVDDRVDRGREARPFRHRPRRAAGERREGLTGQAHDLVVVDVAGHRDEHRRGRVARVAPGHQLVALDRAHRVGVAHGRVGQVRTAPQRAREALVDDVARVVVVHLDLFEHDFLLFAQIGRGEHGVLQHVAQHVDRQREMAVDDVGVEARRLLIRHGVELAADGVHLLGDLARRAPRGALEHHVLEQVREPAPLGRLGGRTDVAPHADRGRANVAHRFGQHAQTRGERRYANHPSVPFDRDARKAGSQKTSRPSRRRSATAPRSARGTVMENTVAALGLA